MRTSVAGVLLAVFSLTQATAQQPRPATAVEERTAAANKALQEALEASKAENKVLLVTFGSDAGRAKINEQMLAAPATAGWIQRHAMVFAVSDTGLIRSLTEAKLTQTPGGDPLMFADGVLASINKGSTSLALPGAPRADAKTVTGKGSIAMAMRLDWTLRMSPALSADYLKRHEQAMAPSAWPGPSLEKPAVLLEPLRAARGLAREKKWAEAANAYANLWWSCAPAAWTAPVRVGTMAAEMNLIAEQSSAAKERFEGLRAEYARAMDVRDLRQVHEYLILCRVVGDHEHNLRFLDEATQSKGAVASIPTGDLIAMDWMLPRCHWNNPLEGVNVPHAWCVQIFAQCDRMETRKDASPSTQAIDYGRWLARVEAARRFAALLSVADPNHDQKAADLRSAVLAADESPELRCGMVAAALAVGQKRADLGGLIKDISNAELSAELAK